MRVTLVATYELGRQPFGLASPAAWLREAGIDVTTVDLSREPFRPEAFATDLVAFHLPMHTATRQGGVASISVGRVTTLVWEIVGLVRGVDGTPDYLLGWATIYPALALSIGTLIVVSLATPAQSDAEVAALYTGAT